MPLPLLALAGIGAALGAGKSALIDAPKAERQRKLAAATQRYSPWTGMRAGKIQEADPFGSAMKYGMTGASLSQGLAKQAQSSELVDLQKEALQGQIDAAEFAAMDAEATSPFLNNGGTWGAINSNRYKDYS